MAVIKKFRIKSFKEKETLVELKNISMFYNKRQILNNLSIKINRQEVLGMLGPNGVGKSTIFHIITGLRDPSYGKILINGIDCTNLPIYDRSRIRSRLENLSYTDLSRSTLSRALESAFCENGSQKEATFTRNHGVLTTWMEYLDSDLAIYAIVGLRNAFKVFFEPGIPRFPLICGPGSVVESPQKISPAGLAPLALVPIGMWLGSGLVAAW